ncbi:hypothetical protein, partial [Methylobrevis pamukkalensis]|uniref:hypothetical protein n=1 Tax=Methylobrevis pamukkalensis TaxID=1439726 RepID=UPI00114CDCEE
MYADGAPLTKFRDGRRRPIGILGGSLRFLGWSLSNILRGLAVAGRRGPAATAAVAPAPQAQPAAPTPP